VGQNVIPVETWNVMRDDSVLVPGAIVLKGHISSNPKIIHCKIRSLRMSFDIHRHFVYTAGKKVEGMHVASPGRGQYIAMSLQGISWAGAWRL
jgi:hypothetical protein